MQTDTPRPQMSHHNAQNPCKNPRSKRRPRGGTPHGKHLPAMATSSSFQWAGMNAIQQPSGSAGRKA